MTPPRRGRDPSAAAPPPPPVVPEGEGDLLDVLEGVLAGVSAGFCLVDRAFRFVRVSPALAGIDGTPVEKHLGRTVAEVVGPAYWAEVLEPLFRRAFDGEAVLDHVLPAPRDGARQGAPRRVCASFFPVRVAGRVASVAAVLRDVTEQHRAERHLREQARFQKTFMRDVLEGVTGGKLVLCDRPQDLPAPLPRPRPENPVALTREGGIRELRRAAEAAAGELGFGPDAWFDFETAVGEAAMNAVVHAGVGSASVFTDGRRHTVQVRVEDRGAGIAVENLPRATLQRGFTTAGTMGHGFKMILQTVDRVYLLTGPAGTTVVLEKDGGGPATG